METKDFVLLMMIPIILIGLVIYTDKGPGITGAVTAQQEKKESNIVGTYSIMPSFKAKINYDLNDYKKIKESLDFIIKCSEEGNDVESCMKQAESKDNSFSWELGCDKGAEKVLYDFAEFYQDCFDSEDNNCLCRRNMRLSSEELKKYELYNKKYTMVLEQDIPTKKIEIKMLEPSKDLSYNINLDSKSRSVWYPNSFVLAYVENKIEMIFKNILAGTDPYYYSFPPEKKELVLYKHKIDSLNIVDFLKEENNELFYPNDQKVETKDIHKCQLKPKNMHKFCVTQKNSKFTVYDKADGLVKERTITIKFASYVPDPPPLPITGIEAYDRPKAEKSVLFKWDKSPANDVVKYIIYYTESLDILKTASTNDLKKNDKVLKKEIKLSDEIVSYDGAIDITNCEFDYENKKCIFSTNTGEKIAIDNDKLYYFKSTDSYVYNFILPENKAYEFAITAVDKNNNEIDNIKQKLPIAEAKSIDDLPPDSANLVVLRPLYDSSTKEVTFKLMNMPSKNIDGSEVKDLSNYKAYYKKYDRLETIEEMKKAVDNLKDSLLKELKFAATIDPKTQASFKIALEPENPATNNVFYFVIVATDNIGNPKEEQFKVKELGAVPLQLIIQ